MTSDKQSDVLARIRQDLQASVRPTSVLLVEDNEFDATLALQTLTSVGVNAHWAKDSVEVEEYLSKHNPALVFLDLNLGSADRGLNVLRVIRSQKPECSVIILTGVYDQYGRECQQALDMRARAVMSKPLQREDAQFIFSVP